MLAPFGLYLGWLSQTELPDGQCSGLGWGCSLAGWDAAGIAAVLYGVPVALLWLTGHLVIALLRRRRRRRASSRTQRVTGS